MNLIHAFWFVADAAAETIAMSPLLPICFASSCTWLRPIAAVSAWLMNSERHFGASESYVITGIFLAIAERSAGQSAALSVAETIRAFAPFVIAALIAGICEAAVACVPLVSVPFSPSFLSAASAPPDLTLSAVVKYGLPRFFGITKILRPFSSGGLAADAIAIGTTARMSTSPSAVTAPETRLLYEVRITLNPFDDFLTGS